MAELIESMIETDLDSLISGLFTLPAQDPFSVRFEIDDTNEEAVIQMLQTILIKGAYFKFQKAIHSLNENEASIMKQYFQSFGWDILYEKENASKPVTDYHEDGSSYIRNVEFAYWKFTFQPADQRLNRYNSHVMPAHL